MDYSVTFARHFSRMVWLLLHEPQNTDEQKAALRAVNTVSKDGPVTLGTREWRLVVNGAQLPEALTGVQDLAAQLIGHAVVELHFSTGTPPAELLGVARILAAEPMPGDGGAAVVQKLQALGAQSINARVRGLDSLVKPTPIGTPVRIPAPNAPAAAPAPAPAPEPPPAAPSFGADDDLGLPDIVDEEDTAKLFGPASDPVPEPASATPAANAPAPASAGGATPPGRNSTRFVNEEEGSMFLAFSAVQTPSGTAGDLLTQLDATRSVNTTTRVLDELVTLAENGQRDGKSEVVADVFAGIIAREAQAGEGDLKRAFVMAVRRLSKPTVLRAVAQLLPRRRDANEKLMLVLTRTGEDGADALIEQLSNASSLAERRVYFDALVKLNAGVPALIHMLGDARWYVARNAADLLGEMQAPEAEQPLIEMLKHDDDRVRRAAATALAKLGTPKAIGALHAALRDTSPQVRLQAVTGLAARRGEKTSGTLVKVLDEEMDSEVQLEILRGLGRLATSDAVQKLIKAAEPEGRFFKKKGVPYRVAAVHALAEAKTSAALAALQSLANDREKEVREAVVRALVAGQTGGKGD
jgi:HEAT repeat protein